MKTKKINLISQALLAFASLACLAFLYSPNGVVNKAPASAIIPSFIIAICLICLIACSLTIVVLEILTKDRKAISVLITIAMQFTGYILFAFIIKNYFVASEVMKSVVDLMIILSTIIILLVFTLLFLRNIKRSIVNKSFAKFISRTLSVITLAALIITTMIFLAIFFTYLSKIVNKLRFISESVLILLSERTLDGTFNSSTYRAIFSYNLIVQFIAYLFVIVVAVSIVIKLVVISKSKTAEKELETCQTFTVEDIVAVIKNKSFGFLYNTIP